MKHLPGNIPFRSRLQCVQNWSNMRYICTYTVYLSAQPVLGYSESSAGLYSSGYLEAGYFESYARPYSSGYLETGYFEIYARPYSSGYPKARYSEN
jgi:hypothetical protein